MLLHHLPIFSITSLTAVLEVDSTFTIVGWIIALGVIGLWVGSLKTFIGACLRLRALLRRGYSEGALEVLTNYGRSLWLVGSDGLYVAFNDVPIGCAPNINFFRFDELARLR